MDRAYGLHGGVLVGSLKSGKRIVHLNSYFSFAPESPWYVSILPFAKRRDERKCLDMLN